MVENFHQKGFAPLFILLLMGIVVFTGGLFVVREQFIKKATDTSKASLDESKIKKQIESGEKVSPQGNKEGSANVAKTFTYQPSSTENEPKFSINPPTNWAQGDASGNIKVLFVSPDKDKEAVQPPLTYYNNAQIAVVFIKNEEVESVSQMANIRREKALKDGEIIVSELPIKVDSQDAIAFEAKWRDPKSGVWLHYLTYVFVPIKGYALMAQGSAIDSSWRKRISEIESSLKSINIY